MAGEADHITLANKNHAALELLCKSGDYPEWVTTIAFYKAVHIVEAVFAYQLGRHSNGHDDRLEQLKSKKFQPLFTHFRPLYCASLVARYLVDFGPAKLGQGRSAPQYKTFTDYMPTEKVMKSLVQKRLRSIEDNAVSLLSEAAKSSMVRCVQS
ncbi:hypothetical protein [Fuerstiella marisgermanici]|uniref:HEPN domain-containing protein n=1 Tax=Fuerstiella marisgermanici TaxID=1891926 RepID=A0A1P8WS98_9PLAN|nr:hypothetical protein [Fuerstiella marisgermanici]APZ96937.1 hypothetical protein Fuma_06613 [Fuerstiella marisgermanici]